MSSMRRAVSALICVFLCSAWAPGQGTNSAISGTVVDAQGATVPAAAIAIKNLETGLERHVTSDEHGYYRAVGLPSGRYEVRAEHSGFDTEVRTGVTLTVAEELVVNFNLQVRSVKEEVVI